MADLYENFTERRGLGDFLGGFDMFLCSVIPFQFRVSHQYRRGSSDGKV